MVHNRTGDLEADSIGELNRIGENLTGFDRLLAFQLAIEPNDLHLASFACLLQGGEGSQGRWVIDGENPSQVWMRLDQVFGSFKALVLGSAAWDLGDNL